MKQQPEELARTVADATNVMGFNEEEFCGAMARQHRTLQQGFTRLCLRWLYDLSEREHFDARNTASVEAGKAVKEALGPCGYALPTI